MPHFISKNMFLDVNISHNDFFIMPYLRNFRHENLMILPIILESKSRKVAKKNLDSNSLTTKIDSTHEVLFIRCVVKNDRFLYKIDKLTQVSNLNKIKEILSFLASHVDVISHNLSETKKHTKGSNTPFLLKETKLVGLKPHFIEIGFGSGRHILSLAKSNPKKIILGFEIHAPSIRQVLNAIESYQLKNLYICAADARNAMQLIDSSVANAIFLHFPVPWNNAKHRRVMSRDFLLSCFRILRLNGHLNLRSDDLEYVRDSINEMLSAPIAHFEVRKNNAANVISKYEARWNRQQKDIYDLFLYKQSDSESFLKSQDCVFEFDFSLENIESFCNQKWVDKENSVFISIGDMYISVDSNDFIESNLQDSKKLENIESRFYKNTESSNLDSKDNTNSKNLSPTHYPILEKDSKNKNQTPTHHPIKIVELTFGSFYVPFSTYLVIENGNLHYLKYPLNIKSHIIAHKFLCKILNNKLDSNIIHQKLL